MLEPLVDHLGLDYTAFWSWFLIFTRMSGLFVSLPGIGTDQVPGTMRTAVALAISVSLALAGVQATAPAGLLDAGLMIMSEFILGYLLGFLPMLVISGLAVSGQVVTGAIGLGQANMIDPSLGGSVAVLARFQSLFATLVFLLIDGHHVILKVASATVGDIGIGLFKPDAHVVNLLLERFASTFELSVIVSGPILVTILVTQFVLGLITRFVPQVNIFIISLPLTIVVGLYLMSYTFPGVSEHLIEEFRTLGEHATTLVSSR